MLMFIIPTSGIRFFPYRIVATGGSCHRRIVPPADRATGGSCHRWIVPPVDRATGVKPNNSSTILKKYISSIITWNIYFRREQNSTKYMYIYYLIYLLSMVITIKIRALRASLRWNVYVTYFIFFPRITYQALTARPKPFFQSNELRNINHKIHISFLLVIRTTFSEYISNL